MLTFGLASEHRYTSRQEIGLAAAVVEVPANIPISLASFAE
jgi:hypothetical protein